MTTETSTGLTLPCLACGETGCIKLRLEDRVFECSNCDSEQTPEEIESTLAKWTKVLKWVKAMPTDE